MNKKTVLIGVLVIVIILIIIIFAFLPKENPSNDTYYSKGLKYSLNSDGNGYSVIGIGSCSDALIVIPEKYNGKPVTAIGEDAFSYCKLIEKVQLPDSIKSIGNNAFKSCESLNTINIPNSVTRIGSWAFSNCAIETINISNSVTRIGSYAFYSNYLESVVIPDSVKIIGDKAFASNYRLTSVTIGKSVVSIGSGAFDCSSLQEVFFKDTLDWTYSFTYDPTDTGTILANELKSPAKAAEYLSSTYVYHNWKRVDYDPSLID